MASTCTASGRAAPASTATAAATARAPCRRRRHAVRVASSAASARTVAPRELVSAHPDAIRRREQAERRRSRRQLEEQVAISFARGEGGAGARAPGGRRSPLENVKEVASTRSFLRELRGASNRARPRDELSGLSRLAVLHYGAPWCRACRAFKAKLFKIARDNPRVLFISLDIAQCEDTADALGVERLPFVQFYSPATGVFGGETGSTRPERIERLKAAISSLDVPRCDISACHARAARPPPTASGRSRTAG